MQQPKPLHIVCFGGGTGLSTLLSGIRNCSSLHATAIVSMFDNGGSSGILHDRFGVLPTGDIFKCILALSPNEPLARALLLQRIESQDAPEVGHTPGNVLVIGLERVYGSYRDALDALSRILAIRGRAVPASFSYATLVAHFQDGETVYGEVNVDRELQTGNGITRLFLNPLVRASDEALQAIRNADVICIGPGSLYTSILPTLLPHGIREAIKTSPAPIIYIANLVTEGEGMNGHTISHAVQNIEEHAGRSVTTVIANNQIPTDDIAGRYTQEGKRILVPQSLEKTDPRYIAAPLWTTSEPFARHSPRRLATIIESRAHTLSLKSKGEPQRLSASIS